MKWSVCTCVMNRNEHLRQSLPTWLRCRGVEEVIIVDWSSRENVREVVDEFQDGRIVLVRVNGQKRFHQGRTKNLKIRLCCHEAILSVDADIKVLSPDFLVGNPVMKGVFRHGWFKDQRHTTGTCLIHKDDFLSVNGYNEILTGYGWEDRDFYIRLNKKGAAGRRIERNQDYLFHIPHSDDSRVECLSPFLMKWLRKDGVEPHRSSRMFNARLSRLIPWGQYVPMRKYKAEIFYPDKAVKRLKI